MWRRIEAPGLTPYYYNEELGVSRWKRPPVPSAPLSARPPDLPVAAICLPMAEVWPQGPQPPQSPRQSGLGPGGALQPALGEWQRKMPGLQMPLFSAVARGRKFTPRARRADPARADPAAQSPAGAAGAAEGSARVADLREADAALARQWAEELLLGITPARPALAQSARSLGLAPPNGSTRGPSPRQQRATVRPREAREVELPASFHAVEGLRRKLPYGLPEKLSELGLDEAVHGRALAWQAERSERARADPGYKPWVETNVAAVEGWEPGRRDEELRRRAAELSAQLLRATTRHAQLLEEESLRRREKAGVRTPPFLPVLMPARPYNARLDAAAGFGRASSVANSFWGRGSGQGSGLGGWLAGAEEGERSERSDLNDRQRLRMLAAEIRRMRAF